MRKNIESGHKYCFATGSIYSWTIFKDTDKVIEFFSRYGFYGGELTFATFDEIMDFNLNEDSRKYLRSLKYLSLHLPFRHTFRNDKETEKIISKVLEMIDDLNIDAVVIHHHQIEDDHCLKRIPVQLCFENMTAKRGYPIEYYGKAMESHPGTRLILDTTHALTWSITQLNDIYDMYKPLIQHVHYSEFIPGRQHLPIHHNIHNLLEKINALDVPIIIEVDYDKDDFDSFEKDMEFIGVKKK